MENICSIDVEKTIRIRWSHYMSNKEWFDFCFDNNNSIQELTEKINEKIDSGEYQEYCDCENDIYNFWLSTQE